MRKAYYARPISIDGTPQEGRNITLIMTLGFEPWPVGDDKEKAIKQYAERGMEIFKPFVEESDVLIFQAFPDGSIGAGVAQEIAWAQAKGIPVIEIPQKISRRTLSVDDTREMLRELGKR